MTRHVGVYPGTFDPVTNGHLDIIERAARILDRLVIGVALNAGKGPLFPFEERVELVRAETDAIAARTGTRVEVVPFEGLLVGFARQVGAGVVIRGLRAVSDFDYEFQMAGMNHRLDPGVETVFLMASETHLGSDLGAGAPARRRAGVTSANRNPSRLRAWNRRAAPVGRRHSCND